MCLQKFTMSSPPPGKRRPLRGEAEPLRHATPPHKKQKRDPDLIKDNQPNTQTINQKLKINKSKNK